MTVKVGKKPQPINQSTNLPLEQSTNQSTDLPLEHSTNQSINQLTESLH